MTRWWILKWDAKHRAYRIVQIVQAATAPAALLAGWWRGDPAVIARPENDPTVPVVA